MPTANEQILAREIAHQIRVEQLKAGTVRRVLSHLEAMERQLRDEIEARVARILAAGYDSGPFRTRDLKRRQEAVKAMIAELRKGVIGPAYRKAGAELGREMHGLAQYESEFQRRLLQSVLPPGVNLGFVLPSAQQLAAIVDVRPFHGLTLKDWVRDLTAKELAALEKAVSTGLIRGEGIQEIVRRVFGTKTRAGVVQVARRHAETWVRSAVAHTMNEARDATMKRNSDLLRGVVWVSTLDTRTSDDCIVRDGLEYSLPDFEPIGHSIPWGSGPGRIHPKCRSGSAPALRSMKELGFDLKDFPESTRASMDGQVPAKTTFPEWAAKQGKERLSEIFGKTRAGLITSGELGVKDLFGRGGRFLTLSELGKAEASPQSVTPP